MKARKHLHQAILLFLLAAAPALLHAQIEDYLDPSEAVGEAVYGIASVAEMIISDSFTPMTDFDREDLSFIGSASLFKIEQAHEDPLVEGEDFGGWAVGAGAGWAVRDRWLIYGILSAMNMNGDLVLQPYEALEDRLTSETGFTFLSLNGGLGYEVFENDWLSVPVYFGPHLQYYSVEIVPEQTSELILAQTYTFDSTVTGSGFLFGFSGGTAAKIEILNRWAFTPYILGLANISSPKADAEVGASGGALPLPLSLSTGVEGDPFSAVMFGLDVGYHAGNGWSFSFALGDLIAYLFEIGNTAVNDGIRMRPLIFVATFAK